MYTHTHTHTQAALSTKVNTLDLTSLMPQGGSDEGPSLMPKLLEMQTKLSQVEAQLASTEVPSDKLAMMQNAIDRLQSQLSTVSVHTQAFISQGLSNMLL